jgi:beta-glucanase (GH16 family)
VTGAASVVLRRVVLRFRSLVGDCLVSALAVTSDGPNREPATLFSDDFSGPRGAAPDRRYWDNEVGARRDDGLQGYTSERANSSLDGGGHLVITARKERYDGTGGVADYTSGRVVSKGKVTFGYGHVEARMTVPEGQGMWPAFWALGADIDRVDWPRSGEIDVMEYRGGEPTTVGGHVHVAGYGVDRENAGAVADRAIGRNWDSRGLLSGGFHTYAVDYQPGAITFRLDGRAYLALTPEDVAADDDWPFEGQPYYFVLNLAVGGWAGTPDPDAPFPRELLFDYVKVTT